MAVESAMVPEILAGFTESIMIDDDDETGLVMDIPSSTGTADVSTISAERPDDVAPPVTPARGQMKQESIASTEVDVTARIPMKPARVHTPKRKHVEVSMPEVSTVSKVSTDMSQLNVKTISGLHLANAAMNFHLSTMQVAEQLAMQYVLDEEQGLEVVREIQKIRLGAKSLALKIRSEFPLNVKSESDRSTFLDWLENTTRLAASHESDDDLVRFMSSMRLSTRY